MLHTRGTLGHFCTGVKPTAEVVAKPNGCLCKRGRWKDRKAGVISKVSIHFSWLKLKFAKKKKNLNEEEEYLNSEKS